jgi:hypothetical protein
MKRAMLALFPVTLALMVLSVSASAQTELRTVRGTVMDGSETPLASAVVYLKNARTLTVRTYISDGSGQYRFSGLDPNVDYEVHAERDNQTSANRTISSFDTRKEIVISLKVDKEKKK